MGDGPRGRRYCRDDEVLRHMRMMCEATYFPLNADFEAGFAEIAEQAWRKC